MRIGEVPLWGNIDNDKDLSFVVTKVNIISLGILQKDKKRGG